MPSLLYELCADLYSFLYYMAKLRILGDIYRKGFRALFNEKVSGRYLLKRFQSDIHWKGFQGRAWKQVIISRFILEQDPLSFIIVFSIIKQAWSWRHWRAASFVLDKLPPNNITILQMTLYETMVHIVKLALWHDIFSWFSATKQGLTKKDWVQVP